MNLKKKKDKHFSASIDHLFSINYVSYSSLLSSCHQRNPVPSSFLDQMLQQEEKEEKSEKERKTLIFVINGWIVILTRMKNLPSYCDESRGKKSGGPPKSL